MKISGRSDRSIEPGKTEEITISLSAKGTGEFTRDIPVRTNDAKMPSTKLTCRGRTLVAMKMDAPLVNFGKIARDAPAQTKTIKIMRGDGGPVVPELAPTNNAALKAELREIKAGDEYELDVTLSPPWPPQSFHGNITLKTGIADSPNEYLAVTAQFDPRLQANPGRFTIPSDASEDRDIKVGLVWSGGDPAKIKQATVNDATLKVRVEEENGTQCVVLSVPAGYQQRMAAFVMVETEDTLMPTLRIPVVRMPARPPATQPGGDAAGIPRQPTTRPIPPAGIGPVARPLPASAGRPATTEPAAAPVSPTPVEPEK